MFKRIFLISLIPLLSSCLDIEKAEILVNINKGGKGTFEWNIYNISSTKEDIEELFKDVETNSALGNEHELLNYKESLSYDNKKLNGYAYGEFTDALHLFQILTEREVELSQNNFHLEWFNGKLILSVNAGKAVELAKEAEEEPDKFRFIFRTEGYFLEGTTGTISGDKKETSVDPDNLTLIIGGLMVGD
jgi:hypothetical protein